MNNKIALTMIARGMGEEENLKHALESITPFIDAVYITLTSEKKECKKAEEVINSFRRDHLSVNVSYGKFLKEATHKEIEWLTKFLGYVPNMKAGDKIFQFDEARNFNMGQVPQDEYPWIVWMDSDDRFYGGENLRKCADLASKNNIEAVYFNYIYQAEFDEKKQLKHVIIEHIRERLVRNHGAYKWVMPIHETLIEQRPTRKTDMPDCYVVHYATQDSRLDSLTRNLRNLEYAIYKTEGKDPRQTYYLAKAYFDINNEDANKKALPLIEQYLTGENKSGWPEERQQACEYLSEIYRRLGNHMKAVESCLRAFLEPAKPSPSVFVNLALCYVMLQMWDLGLYWVEIATKVKEEKSTLVKNVKDVQARVLEIIFNCQLNMKRIDEAWAASVKMQELFPNEPTVNNAFTMINQLRTQRDLVVKIGELANYLTQTGEGHKIKPLLAAVPALIQGTPFVQDMIIKNNPPTPWGENEIAIFCGPGFTHWSPKKLADPKGSFLGGSEEAVIYMSDALTKQGYTVTVYADPGDDEGYHDGVRFLPYYKFNPLDNFNILIVWRHLGMFDQDLKAKKVYFWAHDLQNPLEWTKERYNRMSKAIFLSKFHRDTVPLLPEEKVFLSTNGI